MYRFGYRAEPKASFFEAEHAAAPANREGALTPDNRITIFMIFGAPLSFSRRSFCPTSKMRGHEVVERGRLWQNPPDHHYEHEH